MYRSRVIIFLSFLIEALLFSPSYADTGETLRNPFAGTVSASTSGDRTAPGPSGDVPPTHYVSPLEREPLHRYQLLGVILSEQLSLALIQSPLGSHHTVRVGDRIGNREGAVTSILVNQILVQEGEEERKLFIGSLVTQDGELQ